MVIMKIIFSLLPFVKHCLFLYLRPDNSRHWNIWVACGQNHTKDSRTREERGFRGWRLHTVIKTLDVDSTMHPMRIDPRYNHMRKAYSATRITGRAIKIGFKGINFQISIKKRQRLQPLTGSPQKFNFCILSRYSCRVSKLLRYYFLPLFKDFSQLELPA